MLNPAGNIVTSDGRPDSTLTLMARTRIPFASVLLLCLAGILINAATVGRARITSNFHKYTDFRHFYAGAAIAGKGNLYDVDQVQATQRKLFGGPIPSLSLLTRLPFYYAFLSPLAALPFEVAQWVWLGGMALAIGIFACLRSGLGRGRTAIACCWSWPLLWSLPQGQDVALVLLLMGAGLWALYARKNWWLAGLLFSLCLIKFNLFLLCPLLIMGKLGRRKWRLVAGFLAGSACLAVISFLVSGSGWPPQYLSHIFNPVASPALEAMPNLHGLMVNLHGGRVVEFLFSLGVIGMVWWVVRHRPFGVAAAATILGSLLVSQHAYIHDCGILIPALLTLIRPASGEMVRLCALLLLLPMPYEFSFDRESGTVLTILLLVLMAAVTWASRSRRAPATARSEL